MKVAIDVSQVVFGSGVSDYTQNLLANLNSDFTLPFGFSLHQGGVVKNLIPNTRVFPLPLSLVEWLWNRRHILPVENFVSNVDIYHSSDWTQAPSSAKKVTTIHDLTPFLYPDQTLPKIREVHARKMSWAVKECDAFICVSSQTAVDLIRLFNIPSKKVFVIPEALPSRFSLTPNTSPYSNYIATMGSRQPRKNISKLISAFLNYRQQYRLPQRLVIIGENDNKSSNPDVIYTGYISNQQVVDIISGSEAFVYPSIYEGFGLPALVGFSCSVPVIASNTSSLPEVCENAAVLVDPKSEQEIAAGISTALKDRSSYIKKGQLQLTKFSWKKTAELTQDVYNHLVC